MPDAGTKRGDRRRIARYLGGGLALALAPMAMPLRATAQGARWPAAKPITLIVPYTAGGSVDFAARLVAQHLGERLQQSIVVENVAGAGGVIGVARTTRAVPDGYTLVMGPDSPIAIADLVNPAAVKYEALKDLAAVGLVNAAPMVLCAKPSLAAGSMAELVALAKSQPGKLNYATSGIGTVLHLAMEIVKSRAQIEVTHVPYRGGAQIVTDLIGNQIDLAMLVSVSAMPSITGNRFKGIAVTARERLKSLADVPALAESRGFENFEILAWTGVFAPAGTPAEIVERLNSELNQVLAMAEVRGKFADQGAVAGSGSAASFADYIRGEKRRYAQVVAEANIKE